MIRIHDISLPTDHSTNQLITECARLLKIKPNQIIDYKIVKKSIDARKKPNIKYVYTVELKADGNENIIIKKSGYKKATLSTKINYQIQKVNVNDNERPIIIGFGPAGMFAALVLAKAGSRPIVYERGADALTRHKKVKHFFETGELDTNTNVQFGEGGAGTFSDGKLNTGINDNRIHWVLEQFVKSGADENILYNAKPHVGTDVLLNVVQNIRKEIISLGGELHFNTQVMKIITKNGKLDKLILSNNEEVSCSKVILAIGHSARDTFEMLDSIKVPMEPKPFSIGVRIEHKQSDIDFAQYGKNDSNLPAADYKLVSHLENETVYTFCMCPGGYVVGATSEQEKVVTNGMSYAKRDGENANSAILVTVHPKDFPYDGVLGGMLWQQQIEKTAFEVGGKNYYAPAQLLGDFLLSKPSVASGSIKPTYRPGVTWCDLHDVLPKKITSALKKGIINFSKSLKGFDNYDSILTAPETRSSSPVKILRNENRQSEISGLYPTGEGAGYAGGIMSAAVDGMLTAEAIIKSFIDKVY